MSTTATTGVDSTSDTTARGTKIVHSSDTSMDKNSFLKILVAEMSNQNPDDAQDSTQYVAQLAQFSSLEQMQNLNDTMTLSNASSLIGKSVIFSTTDTSGNPYSGIVKSASKSGDNVYLNVNVTENGTSQVKKFSYSDIANVTSAS